MLAKSNKIELIEEFMVVWREEQTLSDVMSRLCIAAKWKRQKFEKNAW